MALSKRISTVFQRSVAADASGYTDRSARSSLYMKRRGTWCAYCDPRSRNPRAKYLGHQAISPFRRIDVTIVLELVDVRPMAPMGRDGTRPLQLFLKTLARVGSGNVFHAHPTKIRWERYSKICRVIEAHIPRRIA